jgi:glycosyltransferase involved in cell wall biosynthesis
MKILNVAYPFAPVGRDAVGGAEQVLNHIIEALVCAGHESIAIAHSDSRIPGKLLRITIPEGPLNDFSARRIVHDFVRDTIVCVVERESPDVIHFHGIDFHEYFPPELNVPTLITLHLPPEWYPTSCFAPRDHLHFTCVSAAQAKSGPAGATVIPNGVPIPEFRVQPKKCGYIMCLGRICPEKGFHHALDAAALLNMPLVLAGEIFQYEAHQSYFDEQIVPRLSNERRFIGPIGRARKCRLLAAAQCLVIPSGVNETSSLVAMEALACGTPVVAFRRGALPIIIENGRTGILADSPSDLPDAILAAASIDPDECRHAAREKFSREAMTRQYLSLYEELAATTVTSRTVDPWLAAIDAHTVS